MKCFRPFLRPPQESDIPDIIPSPFSNTPHPLAKQACLELQECLADTSMNLQHDFNAPDGGKMLGALVVRDSENKLGYIAGFSGMLGQQWEVSIFVPPVFDLGAREGFLAEGEARLLDYAEQIRSSSSTQERQLLVNERESLTQARDMALANMSKVHKDRKKLRHQARQVELSAELVRRLSFESQQDKRQKQASKADWQAKIDAVAEPLIVLEQKIELLKKARSRLSNQLHAQVFAGYWLTNRIGETRALTEFYEGAKVPGGAGDCVAPKLIHYAIKQGLTPVALAEFWWGAPPKQGVRHHGHFYPACRGKCRPILPFMLSGYELAPAPALGVSTDSRAPAMVYEDDDVLVVNKPHGLLSVPGTDVSDSVLTRIQQRYPQATGPLLVHRLDLSTSGLLLVAKNAASHKALQKQFLNRTIEKRYVAVLSKTLASDLNQGCIELPLRVDLYDRPRQIVCSEHGKAAKTHWQLIKREQGQTWVYFYPVTGRTHQLRVHASHPAGLNAPILGDELYGEEAGRLRLHAERLCFTHPTTAKRIELRVAAPF